MSIRYESASRRNVYKQSVASCAHERDLDKAFMLCQPLSRCPVKRRELYHGDPVCSWCSPRVSIASLSFGILKRLGSSFLAKVAWILRGLFGSGVESSGNLSMLALSCSWKSSTLAIREEAKWFGEHTVASPLVAWSEVPRPLTCRDCGCSELCRNLRRPSCQTECTSSPLSLS